MRQFKNELVNQNKLKMKKVILVCALLFGFGVQSCDSKVEVDKDVEILNPSSMDDKGLFAQILTNKGTIDLVLEFQRTPLTVANFVGLAEGTKVNDEKDLGVPYYDGLVFHRVIQDFMIQGGCPQGTGSGDPGYSFADEFHADLTHNGPGILSMANSGPTTNGSQFFITHKETPWLDNKHSIFGHVIDSISQDIVNLIETGDTIISVSIIRNGRLAKKFDAEKVFVEAEALAAEKALFAMEAEKAKLASLTEGYTETPSGLSYKIITKGDGEISPTSQNSVTINCTGKFIDGTIFWSTEEGKTLTHPANGFVLGFNEGVQMMVVGDKWNFIIPPALAYGARGREGVIPPDATLIFEVELIEIAK